jgi:hypothetical protein
LILINKGVHKRHRGVVGSIYTAYTFYRDLDVN